MLPYVPIQIAPHNWLNFQFFHSWPRQLLKFSLAHHVWAHLLPSTPSILCNSLSDAHICLTHLPDTHVWHICSEPNFRCMGDSDFGAASRDKRHVCGNAAIHQIVAFSGRVQQAARHRILRRRYNYGGRRAQRQQLLARAILLLH